MHGQCPLHRSTSVLVQERQDSSLAQLDTFTSPISTGLWPSTLQYLLPRLPFGSSQSRPSIVPSPSASAAPGNSPAAELQTPAADSAPQANMPSSDGNGFAPFEAISVDRNDGLSDQSPPGMTAMPFTDPSQNQRGSIGTLDRRPDSPGLSQQESILADSSSRWLEDGDGQSGAGYEEAGSNGREGGEKDEAPRMLFFWRSKRSKQPKPEPEIRPLQVQPLRQNPQGCCAHGSATCVDAHGQLHPYSIGRNWKWK